MWKRLQDAAVDDQDHQNDEDSILLQQLVSDAIRESTDARRGHRNRPHAAASLAEICLASLPGPDLERAISDLGEESVKALAMTVQKLSCNVLSECKKIFRCSQ